MIRNATHEDIPAIVSMGARFIEDVYPAALTFNGDALAALAGRLIDGDGAVFVAESAAGGILGMIAVTTIIHPMTDETLEVEITWWVDPAARGGRAALLLFEEGKAWGRLQGAKRLQLTAPSDKVCRFYERLGAKRVEVAYMVNL